MPTLSETVRGYIASRELDSGALPRLRYWVDALGERELAEITIDDVDAALVALARRERMRPSRTGTVPTGKPLEGSTLNRYLAQISSIYVFARRERLVPRTFQSPTRGLERAPERPDPERYLTPDQVDRLLPVCPIVDERWGRLGALVRLLATTGMRIGNALSLRWEHVDLERRVITIPRTKNGDPLCVALPQKTVDALERLPGRFPSALVFGGPQGRPYNPRRLFKRAAALARLPEGASWHWLRHSAGYAMARAGVSQGQIMQVMGHRSLRAAERYVHQDASDKLRIADQVFG